VGYTGVANFHGTPGIPGPWIRGQLSSGVLHDNSYQYNGTAGLRIAGSAGGSVQRDAFFENRWESGGGGQLYIDYYASNYTVTNLSVDGNNFVVPAYPNEVDGCYGPTQATGIAGIEIEPGTGSSGQNVIAGNEVTRNTQSGISVHSTTSLSLSGYSSYPSSFKYVHDNTGNAPPYNHPTFGIEFLYTSYGSSSGVTLSNVLSENNSGDAVTFQYDPSATGPGWQGYHCLQPTYVTSYSLTNPTPSTTTTCP
jgi:hypothetical protein